MNYTLHQLQVFLAVARHGSIGETAAELMIAQPAISAHIRTLERSLGVRLFDRVGRGIQLNRAGAEFVTVAERILSGVRDFTQCAADLRTVRHGSVTVAASTTAGNYVAPRLLGAFHQDHPGVTVSLHVSNRFAVQRALLSRQADLAIMGVVEPDDRLEVAPFLSNTLVVVARPAHPLVGKTEIPLSALAGEEFLVRERGSGTRLDMEELFRRAGVALRTGLELGSTGAIKEAVMAGLGLAILPLQSLELELAEGELTQLVVEGFPLERHWKVVWLRNRRLSPAAEALRRHLLSSHHAAS